MVATRTTLVTRYPKFAANPTTQVDGFISLATELLNSNQWSSTARYDFAVEALTAHMLQMDRLAQDGAVTAVSNRSKAETDLEGRTKSETVTFASPLTQGKDAQDAWFAQTPYGRTFMMLRDSEVAQIGVVGGA